MLCYQWKNMHVCYLLRITCSGFFNKKERYFSKACGIFQPCVLPISLPIIKAQQQPMVFANRLPMVPHIGPNTKPAQTSRGVTGRAHVVHAARTGKKTSWHLLHCQQPNFDAWVSWYISEALSIKNGIPQGFMNAAQAAQYKQHANVQKTKLCFLRW